MSELQYVEKMYKRVIFFICNYKVFKGTKRFFLLILHGSLINDLLNVYFNQNLDGNSTIDSFIFSPVDVKYLPYFLKKSTRELNELRKIFTN